MVTETKAEKLAGQKLLFMTHEKFDLYLDLARREGRRQVLRETSGHPEGADRRAMAAIIRHRLQISYAVCDCPDCRGQEGFFMVHTTDGRRTKGDQNLTGLILEVASLLEAEAAAKGNRAPDDCGG